MRQHVRLREGRAETVNTFNSAHARDGRAPLGGEARFLAAAAGLPLGRGTFVNAGARGTVVARLWGSVPAFGGGTDALGAVLQELIQDAIMHRFPCGDLAELRGGVGILEEFQQQRVRGIRSAEEGYASGEAGLGVPLVEEPGHLSSDRGQNTPARSGVLRQREEKRLVVPGLRVRGHELFQDIAGRGGISSYGLDDERIR